MQGCKYVFVNNGHVEKSTDWLEALEGCDWLWSPNSQCLLDPNSLNINLRVDRHADTVTRENSLVDGETTIWIIEFQKKTCSTLVHFKHNSGPIFEINCGDYQFSPGFVSVVHTYSQRFPKANCLCWKSPGTKHKSAIFNTRCLVMIKSSLLFCDMFSCWTPGANTDSRTPTIPE